MMAQQAARARTKDPERRFFGCMALMMVAAIIVGFLPSYYLRGVVPAPAPLHPMTLLVHLHGAVFTAWMLLFFTQVLLVGAGRTDIHRRLGLAGMALLPVMIVVAVLAALHGALRASGPPIVPPLSWLAVPLLSIPLFGGLIAAALIKRREAASHKRYMVIAMIEMTSPGFGRWPFPPEIPGPLVLFGFSDLFLLALVLWDFKRFGRVHRATLIGGGALIGSQLLRIGIWQTEPWLAFARWAVSLVA